LKKAIFLSLVLLMVLLSLGGCAPSSDNSAQIPLASGQNDEPVKTVGLDKAEVQPTTNTNDSEPTSNSQNDTADSDCSLPTSDDALQINRLIDSFTQYASEKNIAELVDTFALDDYLNGYNIVLIAEHMGVDPTNDNVQPPTQQERIDDLDSQVSLFYAGLLLEDLDYETMTNSDFLAKISDTDFSSLSVVRIDEMALSENQKSQYDEIRLRCAEHYGAQACDYRTVLFQNNDNAYYCGFSLFKYNDTWKIFELRNSLSGIATSTIIVPISESEYIKMLRL